MNAAAPSGFGSAMKISAKLKVTRPKVNYDSEAVELPSLMQQAHLHMLQVC